ncbi:autotransporter domain-containing protein [Rhodoplanes sp. SY1]|uniref:autotransporter outer membrane beta-barrel domain-containing protein n=1 Tax=Rhodoplanes sp. SY1 TaxID=3166646 RepID=UPI0038B58412
MDMVSAVQSEPRGAHCARLPAWRRAWLFSEAMRARVLRRVAAGVQTAVIVLLGASLLAAAPARADGGAGAGGGGPGGADNATGTGGTGAAGNASASGAGGGAGAIGGAGGNGNGGNLGGAGGATPGASGQNGTLSGLTLVGGSGGGGGAHGFVGTSLPGVGATGGSGGGGGQGSDATPDPFGTDRGGNGGGGGAGGWGAVVTGEGALGTLGVAVTGGNGGGGGFPGQGSTSSGLNGDAGSAGTGGIGLALTGASPLVTIGAAVKGGNGGPGGNGGSGAGGDGGAGGAGILATGATLTILGPVTGGTGGARGSGLPDGDQGAGGIGVTGTNLTIVGGDGGSVTGGLSGGGVRANAIQFTGGTNRLELQTGFTIMGNVVAFSAADTLALGGSGSASFDASQIGPAAQYQGFGVFQKIGSSTWTLTGTTAAVTSWAVNAGTLAVSSDGNLGAASGGLSFDGGTLQFLAAFSSNRVIALDAGGGSFDSNGNTATLAGTIGGTGGLTKLGAGTLTLSGASTYAGPTNVNAGTLQAGAADAFAPASAFTVASGAVLDLDGFNQTIGSLAGGGNVMLGAATLTSGDTTSTIYSGVMAGAGGSLTKTGTGTLMLTGINTYTGATVVDGGALIVNGSIAPSSGLTVDPGALVGGNGFLPTTIINGILSPGNSIGTITVNGDLTFGASSSYLIEVSPSAADRTNVTGTANLSGVVLTSFGGGSAFQRQYTILHADGGLGGTSFGGLATAGAPSGFSTSLSYDLTNVYLDLRAVLGLGTPLSRNEQNVATAVNTHFNNGGTLPANFSNLFWLTGTNLAAALDSLYGEAATGAQFGAFQLGNQFLSLMLDPFTYGRTGGFGGGFSGAGGALPLTAEPSALRPEIALAYAKVPTAPADVLPDRRWSVWGGGFGGSSSTKGDPWSVGSHDITTRSGGYATGIDYRATPDTVLGFALAGGFTNWGLAGGLGGGNSDAFQAGLYGVTRHGPAYLAAAASFAEHWITTDRLTAFAGDHLQASFDAQSFGGRIEVGYRFATGLAGVTPYAALQAQHFQAPGYSETDLNGRGFGLNVHGRDASATRSELGARFDWRLPISSIASLALQARAAWAHDRVSDPTLAPVFQTLPGAPSFVVNGAMPVKDSALTSAGAELRVLNGWSLGARFDGEFADRSQTYAGTGTLRYTW